MVEIEHRKPLTRQHQCDRAFSRNGDSPSGDGLVGIGRSNYNHARDRSQPQQLLNRLVGRTVLSHGDAVMREDIDHWQRIHCCQSHWWAHVITEDQKGSPIGDEPPMQCHAVQNGAHGIFPDAEVHVASRPVLRLKVPSAVYGGMSAGSEIGRASHQFGQLRTKNRNCLS